MGTQAAVAFLEASYHDEGAMLVRPKIAQVPDVGGNVETEKIRAIEVEAVKSDGGETERDEEESEVEEKNPMKWWKESEENGLSQDELRPDPKKVK